MVVPRLEHCNYILAGISDSKAYRLGCTSALKRIINKHDNGKKVAIEQTINDSPFTPEERIRLHDLLEYKGEIPARTRYVSYEAFCFHVTKRKYIPTKHLLKLIGGADYELQHSVKVLLSVAITELDAAFLKRISISGYVSLDLSKRLIFVVLAPSNEIRAFDCQTIFRVTHHVLKWASRTEHMPSKFKLHTSKNTNAHDYENTIGKDVADMFVAEPTYLTYAKRVLPYIVDNAVRLTGFIMTTTANSGPLDDRSDASECENNCTICLSGIDIDDSTDGFRCGHVFHQDCLMQYRAMSNTPELCPICKTTTPQRHS